MERNPAFKSKGVKASILSCCLRIGMGESGRKSGKRQPNHMGSIWCRTGSQDQQFCLCSSLILFPESCTPPVGIQVAPMELYGDSTAYIIWTPLDLCAHDDALRVQNSRERLVLVKRSSHFCGMCFRDCLRKTCVSRAKLHHQGVGSYIQPMLPIQPLDKQLSEYSTVCPCPTNCPAICGDETNGQVAGMFRWPLCHASKMSWQG